MGCVSSKTDINDRHPNIFHVVNVNDQGRPISPGKLEVTESELVFYQRGKNPTRWPLRSLRKYGFDTEVFSFECGRRCPTGHGIYAFQCKKAEQLFNIVQQYITGNVNVNNEESVLVNNVNPNSIEFPIPAVSTGPPVQRRIGVGFQPDGYLNPVQPTSRPHTVLSRPGSVSSNGQLSPTATSPPPVMTEVPLEHNNNKRNSLIPANGPTENGRGPPNYANLGIIAQESLVESSCHVYMNVDTKDIQINTKEEVETDEIHCYANIDTKNIENLRPLISDSHFNSVPPTPTVPYSDMDYITVREVNYVELDLDTGKSDEEKNPAQTNSESPVVPKKSYATIDFPKTIALSQSINPRMETEEGSRKTRHNSTINSLSD